MKVVDEHDEPTAPRWRRLTQFRVNKTTIRRRARKIELATLKHAHRFLIGRWTNIRDVSRHAAGWLVLVGMLICMAFAQILWFSHSYTAVVADSGGTYAEGFVGRLETMNPLFASTPAEVSASKLMFSSLLGYDRDNALRAEAADSWRVSGDGKTYDVVLRKDIVWHDGQKFTANDVVFTVNLMKDSAVRAVQYGNWAGVKAEKTGDYAVRFVLPSVYAPFAHSLTFGILPEHILKNIEPSDLRENEFGRKPVGTGPFMFRRVQIIDPSSSRLVVHMEANDRYFLGKPLLNRFQLHTYETTESLKKAYVTGEVTAALGLDTEQIHAIAADRRQNRVPDTLLNDGMFALLNNDVPLFKDVAVRRAFVMATNRQQLLGRLHNRGVLLDGPLPSSMVGGSTVRQESYDEAKAAAAFDAAGWVRGTNGLRAKLGTNLAVTIVAPEGHDFEVMLKTLAEQWRKIGIDVKTVQAKVNEMASSYLQPRNYDILLNEYAFGADADVYAYWHSSQASPRGRNFANYRSGLIDDILSSAKARLEPQLRNAKYRAFVDQWVKDVPAIALYQPYVSYIATDTSHSFDDALTIADATARYRDIQRWAVQTRTVMKTP